MHQQIGRLGARNTFTVCRDARVGIQSRNSTTMPIAKISNIVLKGVTRGTEKRDGRRTLLSKL